jgi:succinate dehydrogenase/fumarate reductase iron-sulfur protein
LSREEDTITATVFRYDPSEDKEPRFETYHVPWRQDITVLEVLRYIYENFAPISFRYECRMMQCGLCGVKVNQEPGLACSTVIQAPKEITIEPLDGFEVIKDLVVDRKKLIDEKTEQLKPYLERSQPPTEEPEIIPSSQLDNFHETILTCRECYLCQSACPVAQSGHEIFVGPTFMMRYVAPRVHDPRDDSDRLEEAVAQGLWYCLGCGRCREVCWRGADVPRLAYSSIRNLASEEKMIPANIVRLAKELMTDGQLYVVTADWEREDLDLESEVPGLSTEEIKSILKGTRTGRIVEGED